MKVEVLVVQSCLTLCDPKDRSPPGASVHGILQARALEWVTISSSMGSSQPRYWIQVSCTAGRFFTVWATREALQYNYVCVCVCVYKCTYILVSLCNNSYWISYIPLKIPRCVFLCTSGPQRGLSGSISPRVHSTALRLGAESLRGKFTAVHNPPSRNTSISGDVAFKLLYRDTAAEQTPKGKSSPIWIPGGIQ